jgi:cytoskeletal protein RodZ
MPEIGATLREARMRERIDVSEIEAQTKIRAKYLRALENEEWDLLPGPTFVKSFLRTYGDALALDGRALVEEYKLSYERPGEGDRPELGQQPAVAGRTPLGRRPRPRPRNQTPRTGRTGRAGASHAYMAAVGAIGLVIVLLIIGLLTSGKSPPSPTAPTTARETSTAHSGRARHAGHRSPSQVAASGASTVSLRLEPTGEVYVCLIGENGRRLIPGLILQPGAAQPTYHAKRFELTLGNNAVALTIDGTPRTVPASSRAIAYSITRAGRRTLAPAEAPTCK